MHATRYFRPRLERLDDRTLPSVALGAGWLPAAGTPLPSPIMLGAFPLRPPQLYHQLLRFGVVLGTWTTEPTLPDAGRIQDLQGSGVFLWLGRVRISGSLHTPGLILQGHTTGTLVLSNARGSVTLRLTGPPQPGFSPPPSTFQYTITGGTGAYAGIMGQGTASFSETTGSGHRFFMRFAP
jgi:hypothetical protein